jgi:hypothetical protein
MRGEKDGDIERLHLAVKASELLGKAQGDFIKKIEVTNKTPPHIQLEITHAKPR